MTSSPTPRPEDAAVTLRRRTLAMEQYERRAQQATADLAEVLALLDNLFSALDADAIGQREKILRSTGDPVYMGRMPDYKVGVTLALWENFLRPRIAQLLAAHPAEEK